MEATALHLAAFLGHTEICMEFLKQGDMDVNAVDKVNVSVCSYLCKSTWVKFSFINIYSLYRYI